MSLDPTNFRRFGLAAALVITGLLAFAGAATADVNDAMREVQRTGTARVIITMQTGGFGRARWSKMQSVAEQRDTVAAAGAALQQRLNTAKIHLMRRYATLPFAAATVDADQLQRLAQMPEVAAVHLVQVQRKLPAGSGIARAQASLSSSVASIDVPSAWAAGYEGQGYTVAVLDGGFRVTHPMLRGKNVGDACFADSYTDTHGTVQLKAECPSGSTPQIGAGAASNCTLATDSSGLTRCDHGTHVASIAVGNDGTNFGVARRANLMPIDVFSLDYDTTDCSPDPAPCEVTDDIATLDALDYVNDNAATYNVAAVNLSLGGTATSGYCDNDQRKQAIDNLRAKGIAVMIAAGNDGDTGKIDEPACISTAEAVGATDTSTNVASFSNFATTVDFMAPGVSITAASGSNDGMLTLSGTSMATPHAAGAWTIMRSAFPAASADQIEQALKTTGLAVTRSSAGYTVPKIQVMKAITYAAGTVTFTIRDASSGTVLGTWVSPSIPPAASPQFSISEIERNATATQGQAVAQSGRSYYNLEASSTFAGYIQYVVWSPDVGILGNLTSCPAGLSSDGTTLVNVDAGTAADYVSHIRIVNSGAVASQATLTFTSPIDGHQVAQWTGSSIAPGATLDVTQPQIEAQVQALSDATLAGASQYNVTVSNVAGYAQHVIENRRLGVFTDMSAKCRIGAS